MIKFKCSNCNHEIGAPEKYAGKLVRCPKCKGAIRVPESIEKKSAQEQELIKFRCPSCNQKIGVALNYAGKHVRCAKCKNPMRVPQASSQSRGTAAEDQTAVLRAGQEQHSEIEETWGDIGNMDELALAEAKAPSVERQREIEEDELLAYTSGSAYTGRDTGGSQPKKNRLPIIIGAVCVFVVLLVVIVVWSVSSDSSGTENEKEVDYSDARYFVEDYIGLLNEGEIDEARELFRSELQDDAENNNFEKLARYLGKSNIKDLDCIIKSYEEHPEGNEFFFYYMLSFEDEGVQLLISILQTEEDMSVTGIAAQEPFGNTISIGPRSFSELQEITISIFATNLISVFSKFFCGFAIVILLVCLVQVVSMWIIFKKAGYSGWASIVPFYNLWVLAEIGGKPGWYGLLVSFSSLIPYIGFIIGLVFLVIISIGVAKTFNRSVGFGVGLTLVPFVFYPILAFTSD